MHVSIRAVRYDLRAAHFGMTPFRFSVCTQLYSVRNLKSHLAYSPVCRSRWPLDLNSLMNNARILITKIWHKAEVPIYESVQFSGDPYQDKWTDWLSNAAFVFIIASRWPYRLLDNLLKACGNVNKWLLM